MAYSGLYKSVSIKGTTCEVSKDLTGLEEGLFPPFKTC
jgi:hypothetical protein